MGRLASEKVRNLISELIPVQVDRFCFNNSIIKLKEPLTFIPFFIDDCRAIAIEDDDLALYMYGKNSEELESLLQEELSFIWKEYCLESDERLTEGAKKIKEYLISCVK